MSGKLVDSKGNVLKTYGISADIIPVSLLLQAAGVSLSDIGAAAAASPPQPNGVLLWTDSLGTAANFTTNEPKRSAGIVMFVVIDYDNMDDLG
jgi:hypothetical protein